MNRILPFVALLLLTACNRQDQAATPAPDAVAEAPAPPAAKAAVPSLEGAWNVASVGGTDGAAMTVTFGNGKATIAAGCLRRQFTYQQNRNQVTFAAAPAGSSNCGRSPGAGEDAAFAALADANMAVFGKDGGDATLSGFGGTLALERR